PRSGQVSWPELRRTLATGAFDTWDGGTAPRTLDSIRPGTRPSRPGGGAARPAAVVASALGRGELAVSSAGTAWPPDGRSAPAGFPADANAAASSGGSTCDSSSSSLFCASALGGVGTVAGAPFPAGAGTISTCPTASGVETEIPFISA